MFYHLKDRGRFDDEISRFFAAEVVMALQCLHSKVGTGAFLVPVPFFSSF